MAKTKNQSKKPGKDHYESGKTLACLIIVLTVLVAGLTGGLIYAITQMKTAEEREYLAVYEHLMEHYPERKCEIENKSQDIAAKEKGEEFLDVRTCVTTDYGISKDGDPYVSYVQYISNPKTHERKDEKKFTLYFQHRGDYYTEAVGENK